MLFAGILPWCSAEQYATLWQPAQRVGAGAPHCEHSPGGPPRGPPRYEDTIFFHSGQCDRAGSKSDGVAIYLNNQR